MRHPARLSLVLFILMGSLPALAREDDTTPLFALRVQKALQANRFVDFTLQARVFEGFVGHEREIAEVRYGLRNGSNEMMFGYSLQFDRNGSPGSEHRPWQQFRHQFSLDESSFESSIRLEERYFAATDQSGARLRVLNRWNKPLAHANQLRLGYEWVYNLNDISRSTQRGTGQDRLIAGLQHTLASGSRVEFEYQYRYLHIPAQPDRIQHQLQLLYMYNL